MASTSFALLGVLICVALVSASNYDGMGALGSSQMPPQHPAESTDPSSDDDADTKSTQPSGRKGGAFFSYVAQQLPETFLRTLGCLKRDGGDIAAVAVALLGDLGKCSDETRYSLSVTCECMLQNAVPRILNAIELTHKVVSCATKDKFKDTRLCLTLSNVHDDHCPLLIGL